MANKNTSNKNNKTKQKGRGAEIGAGLAAVGAALAAGYYFYVSDNAKKNRKMVADWAVDLKGDVLAKAKTLKSNLNKESLMDAIDEVAQTYYTAKNINKKDVGNAVKELKDNWSKVIAELKKNKKTMKTIASKSKVAKVVSKPKK